MNEKMNLNNINSEYAFKKRFKWVKYVTSLFSMFNKSS